MTLFVLGINHTTAALSLREKVAFLPENIGEALQHACDKTGVEEAVILSTCNRTEIYLAGHDSPDQSSAQKILDWLADYHSLSVGELTDCHYFHNDQDAIRHLMRVASGLDSMILGEPQILGQLKSAFAVAQQQGTVSGKLHSAFQYVFAIAKRVRSETAIGENPVSVAYAAVALSQRIFSDLSHSKALLIGAGKTIELVARHLKEQGIQHLMVANRTLPRAQELTSQLGGEAMLLADIPERLHEADIVISSTASQLPVLGKGAVEQALKRRKHKPMFMVDIAVPRDIEPQVAELDDVYLYTVDDLKEVIDENKRSREEAALDAAKIIDEAIEDYLKELRAEEAVSAIKGFRSKAEQLRDEEIEKALKALRKGDDPELVVQSLARTITNKLLHNPTVQLKKAGSEGRTDVIDLAQQLFEINDGQSGKSLSEGSKENKE